MLKQSITYEDFDGETVTEDFYFNLTKAELIEMEVQYKKGMSDYLNAIIKAEDNKSLVAEFKKIILASYGMKSDDGKRFIKSEELSTEFTQTAAYSALFMKMSSDAEFASKFVTGILPGDLAESVKADQEKEKLQQQFVEKTTATPTTAEIAAAQSEVTE